ncbi:hypothetical protein CB0940_09415 [Cercospora beticola]|uniref:Zn(2)-C6 fungal-type domain-containing protein n=1 Tax=Cercospora beticola TaxID=122368 RepID=A0A2G5HGQ8_CERBT|nr:hypothetical protein CB0940_09415 [Cercospora beticola]PIA91433.1 hypothetical protein CB0940_09415 [Cercospora beticola]WPB06269.1 hypothetical protein RHO25_010926 [Cercospora beticola]
MSDRRQEHDGSGRVRKYKRDVYTPRACDSCKARKIKCSGNTPCSRCVDANTACTYAVRQKRSTPANKPSRNRLDELEKFVQLVQGGLTAVASCASPLPASNRALNGRRVSSNRPRPCPSSFENILGWAQSSLTSAGIAPGSDEEVLSVSTPAQEDLEGGSYPEWSHAVRAIISLPQTTTQALLDLVASDVICMYPCVSIPEISLNLLTLYHTASAPPRQDDEAPLSLMDVEIIKACLLVGACARQSDDDGLVALLESSIQWSVETVFGQDAVSVEDLVMTCLLSISYTQRDQRQKAWRMAGCGARTALELSIDLESSVDPEDETNADKQRKMLFCCISNLDSRSSLMVGLPRILQDQIKQQHLNALDPTCHLRAMHEMDRIADEILVLVREARVVGEISSDKYSYLDFRLKNIESLYGIGSGQSHPLTSVQSCCRIFVNLRANHLRFLVRRGCLSSAQVAASRRDSVEALMAANEQNVWLCQKTKENGPIPTSLQSTFHHFLMAAISSMFLAMTYDPTTYRVQCQRPFNVGLEILEALPHKLRGTDARHRYSMANFRRLAAKANLCAPIKASTVSNSEVLATPISPVSALQAPSAIDKASDSDWMALDFNQLFGPVMSDVNWACLEQNWS